MNTDRLICIFIVWIFIVAWVSIRNCQKDFVPARMHAEPTSGIKSPRRTNEPGVSEAQQCIWPVDVRRAAATGTYFPYSLPENTNARPSLWLHATTNINEPLVEFPMSTNDISILQQIAPEAIGWDGLTQQQKLDSW